MKNQKTETKAYSLWLMPSGEIYNKLANLILQLSKKYSTPKFEPHVTLLGPVIGPEKEIISKASQLADLLKPYEINLTILNYLDEYFRCLFIKAEKTKDVMNANLKAKEVFNRQSDPKYTPHLSLLYGNFPTKTKEKIIAEIGREFNISFKVNSIHLYLTESEVNDWCKVKEFSLK